MASVAFTALVKGAFGGSRYAHQDIVVSLEDGTVRVWDDVAGHYTACHSLTESQCKRLRSAPVVRQARSDFDGRARCEP